jgi:cyclopropane fatty-acyl-phospholipid synthase-like methyltransferase
MQKSVLMDLMEVVKRSRRPEPWAEGEKIPWDEPGFSRRMLKEHLSQEHDWASRRAATIQKHVDWIHRQVLSSQPGHILDLGCGPGLYTSQLARLGHTCIGVDFSPASIEHARESAQSANLPCTYQLEDIREADYSSGHDLVMFIFGEFNVFTPQDARQILQKAQAAIQPGGALLLEVHTFDVVHQIGLQPCSWYSKDSGLFTNRPHIYLQENFWDEDRSVATQRYFIVDAQTAHVTRYASSMQAYTQDQYRNLLEECGFQNIAFYPPLTGEVDPSQSDLFAILARKEILAT